MWSLTYIYYVAYHLHYTVYSLYYAVYYGFYYTAELTFTMVEAAEDMDYKRDSNGLHNNSVSDISLNTHPFRYTLYTTFWDRIVVSVYIHFVFLYFLAVGLKLLLVF